MIFKRAVGCWPLSVGCWLLAVVCCLLSAFSLQLASRSLQPAACRQQALSTGPTPRCCWLLAVACWLLAVGCFQRSAVCCLLLAVDCWLLAVGCFQPSACSHQPAAFWAFILQFSALKVHTNRAGPKAQREGLSGSEDLPTSMKAKPDDF